MNTQKLKTVQHPVREGSLFLIFDKSGGLIVTLGRRQLTLVHRRTDTELLARVEEVQHAKGVATNRLGAELRQVWSS